MVPKKRAAKKASSRKRTPAKAAPRIYKILALDGGSGGYLTVKLLQRIEALRESDPDVDALIADLKTQLSVGDDSPNARAKTEGCGSAITLSRSDLDQLADLIAACVCAALQKEMPDT